MHHYVQCDDCDSTAVALTPQQKSYVSSLALVDNIVGGLGNWPKMYLRLRRTHDRIPLFAALALRFHALYLADVVHACIPQSCDLGVAFDRAGVSRKVRALGDRAPCCRLYLMYD